jgi:hypothetical protein
MLPTPRAEHVWVTDIKTWGDKSAGLLLGWQQDRRGRWFGWVVVAHVGAQDGGPYVAQRWVPAESIVRRGRVD